MNTESADEGPRRIVISLGATHDSAPALEAAERLATALKAELHGLFVEEQALVDLSNLPISHTVLSQAGSAGPLNPQAMEAVFERGAHACRRALSARARHARLEWSFDIARGEALQTVSNRVSGDDLIVVQQSAFGHTAGDLLEMARTVSRQTGLVCVISKIPHSSMGPVVVFDDGGDLGLKAVDLARRIAKSAEVPVSLFIVAADQATANAIERRDLDVLEGIGRVSVNWFRTGNVDQIAATLWDAKPRFVIADIEGGPFSDTRQARYLLRAARAPVVLLRKK